MGKPLAGSIRVFLDVVQGGQVALPLRGKRQPLQELLRGQQLALRIPGVPLGQLEHSKLSGSYCLAAGGAPLVLVPATVIVGEKDGEVKGHGVGVEDRDCLEAAVPQGEDEVLDVKVGENTDLQVKLVRYKCDRVNRGDK